MVIEELEELENVETGLAENEIQEASDLANEWQLHVDLGQSHTNIIVVLKNRACLLQYWESIGNLETRANKVEAE